MTTPPTNDDALLEQFRVWLRFARIDAEAVKNDRVATSPYLPPPQPEPEPEPTVGLYRLVEEFTALRHEVKLETKGSRNVQELVESIMPTLRQAIEQFRSVVPREDQAIMGAAKPLAEAIADMDEALERGRVEIGKARDRLITSVSLIQSDLESHYKAQPWYRRRWLSSYHGGVRDLLANRSVEAPAELFAALLEGYGLIQARLGRAMEATQVSRIVCVGEPVDPTRMSVLAVVDDSSQRPGHVVEEIRRGYTWRGRVLRYAEVRAARERPRLPEVAEQVEEDPESEDDRDQLDDYPANEATDQGAD